MNDAEVGRQITQMVQFIKQEAEEKANEIAVAAEEEFNIEKLQIVEAEKQKIRKDFERKEAQVDVRRKIEYSTALNATRLKVLGAREAAMRSLVAEASSKLAAFSSASSPAYKQLLVDLVVQGVVALEGASAVVRCRQVDLAAVQEACTKAKAALGSNLASGATVTVDTTTFLAPPPNPSVPDAPSCLGGVMVCSVDGRIKISNTLEDRLQLAYQANVPDLRIKIFGKSGGHLRA